jgi:uncharacterized membrane protein YfcA
MVSIAVAGFAAGAINALVGSGTLITFPTLVALGYPPVTATMSNAVGLVAGSVSGTWGYRTELAGQWNRLRWQIPASLAGAVLGAFLLLHLPTTVFAEVVPVLLVLALVLVVIGPRLQSWASQRAELAGRSAEHITPARMAALVLGTFSVGVYGGYFTAAQGILLVGMMGALLPESVQRMNWASAVADCVALHHRRGRPDRAVPPAHGGLTRRDSTQRRESPRRNSSFAPTVERSLSSPPSGRRERGVRSRVDGQDAVEPARVDDSGDDRLAAHQTQFDAALATPLRLVGQYRERAAAHEIKSRDVDHERSGRNDDAGRLADQLAPGVLIAGVDLAAGVDQHRRAVSVGGRPQRAVWIAQLVDQPRAEHQIWAGHRFRNNNRAHEGLPTRPTPGAGMDVRPAL